MTRFSHLLALAALTVFSAGCKSGTPIDSTTRVVVEIPGLGLKVDAPPGAGTSGIGDATTISTEGFAITVKAPGEWDADNLREAETEATNTYNAENINAETLPDGWALSFTNEGSMGTNYWVWVRRMIGETEVWCSVTASEEVVQTSGLEACKAIYR